MNDPRAIAARLLEDDEPEDPKEFIARHSEADPSFLVPKAELIHGDVNTWKYGGAWLMPVSSEIVYIRGLEGEGIEEKDGWDFDVPEDVAENIIRAYGDPELPVDEQPRECENAFDAWQQEMADKHNEAIQMPVYRWTAKPLDRWVDVDALKRAFDDDQWDKLSLVQQNIEAGHYHGFDNFDSYPDNFTRAELSKYLGVKV